MHIKGFENFYFLKLARLTVPYIILTKATKKVARADRPGGWRSKTEEVMRSAVTSEPSSYILFVMYNTRVTRNERCWASTQHWWNWEVHESRQVLLLRGQTETAAVARRREISRNRMETRLTLPNTFFNILQRNNTHCMYSNFLLEVIADLLCCIIPSRCQRHF